MEWTAINLITSTQNIRDSHNFPPGHHRENVSLIATHTSYVRSMELEESNRAAEVSA